MIDLEKLRHLAEGDVKRGREWSTTSRDVLMLLEHIARLEEKLKNKEAVQAESLRLADDLDHRSELFLDNAAADELRRQHARILELEEAQAQRAPAQPQWHQFEQCQDAFDAAKNRYPQGNPLGGDNDWHWFQAGWNGRDFIAMYRSAISAAPTPNTSAEALKDQNETR